MSKSMYDTAMKRKANFRLRIHAISRGDNHQARADKVNLNLTGDEGKF